MKYTTLLFDLDDTLLDFGKAEKNAVNKIMEKYSVEPSEKNRQLYVKMNREKWTALEKGEITRNELFSTRFKDYFAAVGIEADSIKANDEYISFLGEGSFIMDGVQEVCEKLYKIYNMYIITNGAKKAQEGRLRNSPLMKFFKGVFISEEIGFDKPKKEYFDYVFSKIEEKDKSKILVIGDSLYSDIAGAVNSGVDSCWLNREKCVSCEIYPTYTINNLNELFNILNI